MPAAARVLKNLGPEMTGAIWMAPVLVVLLLLVSALPVSAAWSSVVTAGDEDSGAVALTFDDGWSRPACASIARTLRAHGTTGTFFINGDRLLRAPAAWRRILRGQQIGNHARRHRALVGRPNQWISKQIRQNEAIHERILGRQMLKLIRPPYGVYDGRIRRIAGGLGYRRTVLWNVASGDTLRSATIESVISNSIGAEPGSIILMHCNDNATPAALATIIRHYKERGIKLVGLKQLLDL